MIVQKPPLEDAIRRAAALRPRSLGREIHETVGQMLGSFRETDYRQTVDELRRQGVLVVGDQVALASPGELHQATLELLQHHRPLLEKQVSGWGWNYDPNGPRLKMYLDLPLKAADMPQHDRFWACRYWAPPWDADFFFGRRLSNQALLLPALRPALWSEGVWEDRFELLWDFLDSQTVKEMSLELALARGHWQRAQALIDSSARRKGYGEVLQFLQGDVSEAYTGLLKRIARRKPDQPALETFVAFFARLAALRMNDLETLADPRLGTSLPRLDRFFSTLARYLKGAEVTFPAWPSAGAGLEWCLLWCLRDCLPFQLQPRPECVARLRASGLHAWLDQLDDPRHPWGARVRRQESWRVWLEAVHQRGRAGKPEPDRQPGHLVWEVTSRGLQAWFQGLHEDPLEVPLHTLIRKPPDYLSELDHKVIARIDRRQWSQEVIIGSVTEAVRALIGHPHVIYQGRPARLLEIPQRLYLQRTAQGYRVELKPPFGKDTPYRLRALPDGVLEICFPSRWASELQPLLEEGHEIPVGAEEEMRQALAPWLDKFEVDYAPGVTPLAEVVRDGQLVARLQPIRSGLRLSWAWKLPDQGPAFPLLRGPRREALHWHGRLLQVERNFARERKSLEELLARQPELPDQETVYTELEEALDLLRLLQEAEVACEWPEGKAWKLRPRVDCQGFNIRVSSESDWFDVQGQLRVDESLVLELGRTLHLLREFPGRYVRLEGHDYVEIGDELRRQIGALDQLLEEQRGELRLSPLAVPSLDELDLSMQTDDDFARALERFAAAAHYRAPLPVTLTAELRDYQLEGFQWLAQRAQAGVGACLADDMGLGKTVQALALFLHTRPQGPHLVVCPTSVVANWRDQMLQFAPSLRPRLYEGKDRGDLLEDLQVGDVLITSYRILLQDQSRLGQVPWNVALLDEAQFIKNSQSKTARASYALRARLRVATTGTPIENRLTELWSLFRFLNPALLGSQASFRKRFDTNLAFALNASQRRLKRLVAPFLLRRTKSQVLSELPPRTEIALQIELSVQERALYEQLRRQAEEGLEKQGQRFELLAHLTRMRQACCHPRLILDQPGLTSSKLKAFLELFRDLQAGRHRCLVFSQFTRLLDLLEAELRGQKISYLRLDGSTPALDRRQRVDAFQQGQGELFLISLKAGGTGLNLTGADYVVHLDPWWNPAAEDQASDRAHRIGQQRPVTIYRLIARDTIEEKVVRLHGHKRKLAHDVLQGREQAVDLQQLRQLLTS